MYPEKFDYYRANSVEEAINLLQEHQDAKLLAGGHSLLPAMKLRLAAPQVLVDIGRLNDLKGITHNNGLITMEALTTYSNLLNSQVLQEQCPLLIETAALVADQQVRNKGTIGGSLVHADPAADLPATLMVLEATFHLTGPNGNRQVAASDFFVDLLTTVTEPDELLTAIEIKPLAANTGTAYLKFEHPASGFAICGAAAIVTLGKNGLAEKVSLCFNGVSTTPYHANTIAQALVGTDLNDEAINKAVDENLSIEDPMQDIHASGPYRIQLAKVYGKRALKLAYERAK